MLALAALLLGCGGTPEPPPAEEPAPLRSPPRDADFNADAALAGLPLAQRPDGDIVRYWSRLPFNGDLDAAKAQVLAGPPALPGGAEQAARLMAVRRELDANRVTLLETDLSGSPDAAMVKHLVQAAEVVERLFALQVGTDGMFEQIPPGDLSSLALFERNQGPACQTPQGRESGACSALDGAPTPISGLYPPEVQSDGFCSSLAEQHPDVLKPFVVARSTEEGLVAVPYSEAWPEQLSLLATRLRAAADAAAPDEAPLAAYLRAAAQACEDNDWFAADAAWAAMNQHNSRWYVRVGPDEVYEDPCGQHALFALTLARIDPSGLRYQGLLEPVKQDMELLLAEVAGPPYAARAVGFHLPEFVQIALNAGDSRSPYGATVGQSLPNWGPVAEAGGRTIAMTNLGTDPAGLAAKQALFKGLLCESTWARWPRTPEAQLYSTVLHEAGHNLGPSGEYRVDGKVDGEVFGGPQAAVLEELKAQMTAMYLVHRLPALGVHGPADPIALNLGDVGYAIAKLPEGMYEASGVPNAYAQLSAIQLGYLHDQGALAWRTDQLAADGSTPGCLDVSAEKLPAAVDALTSHIFQIKSKGDKAAAQALIDTYVVGDNQHQALFETLVQRTTASKASTYVYRLTFEGGSGR